MYIANSGEQVFHGANIGRIDPVSLRLAVVCADVGSLKHAAPLCHMSTMCASRRLQRLEEGLGVPLFYRRRAGLEPTEAGTRVIEKARQVLSILESLMATAAAAPEPVGNVYENCGRSGRHTLAARTVSGHGHAAHG